MVAIVVGQEIDQQLSQPAIPACCLQMVRRLRTLFVAAKKVGSGEHPHVSHDLLATQTQNVRQLADC
ncbi:hypothetical protein BFX40_10295 [Mesorhizobium sp. SEMIA 3007]|nr:hypothetical protein BFX40_10295 [Mesorhizobium sp. SEMIA 3007]